MKPVIGIQLSAQEKFDQKAAGNERGGKAIAAHVRIHEAGNNPLNFFILDDGSEVIEDDAGNVRGAKTILPEAFK